MISSIKNIIKKEKIFSPQNHRKIGYFILLFSIYAIWLSYMTLSESWHLFLEFWPISLTMTLGSFVAGATAEGGAAIAFPVFTKILHIPSSDARTFGLMIQAVGMTMAGAMIYAQRVRILPKVVLFVSLGGILGQVLGSLFIAIPNPYPKILFTFVATAFGAALAITRWWFNWPPRDDLPDWNFQYQCLFIVIGVIGGIFAANTGSGIDMFTFVVLTLAFGINEKISTPTTVTIMGINSIVGFFIHGAVLQDIGIAWNYWLVAIPIVIIGAPLGALVCARVKRDHIIKFLLSLILLELVTTLLLVPFSTNAIIITTLSVMLCGISFAGMLLYRRNRLFNFTSKTACPKEASLNQVSSPEKLNMAQ